MPRTTAPDHVPASIRDHPLLIDACAARDLGRVLRVIQNLSDGTFTDSHLGRRCGLSPSRVADYMAGRHQATSNAVFERVADGLRIPGGRFGMAPRDWEAAEPIAGTVVARRERSLPSATDAGDPLPRSLVYAPSIATTVSTVSDLGRADMLRRSVLINGAYVIAALATSSRDWLLSSLEALDAGKGRRVGPDDIQEIRSAFTRFQEADVIGGGGDDVRRAVAAYLTEVVLPVVRQPQSPAVQEALYEVTAEQTYLAGWMAYDSGRHGLAQRYLIQSLRLAQASGNPVLGSHVLAGLSDQATQLGAVADDPEYGRQLVAEGRSLAQAGRHGLRGVYAPAAMTDLYVLEARAHAVLGDARDAVHCLDAAEQWYDRIDVANEAEWARFIDEGYVTGEMAGSLRDLGDANAADRFATQSIAACRLQGRARRQSLSYAVLADSHVQRGDVEAAADAAGRSLDLAGGVPSVRCTVALEGTQKRLAPFAGHRLVDEFSEALAGAGR